MSWNTLEELQWVAFDMDVFLEPLGKLTEYNDYLKELRCGHQTRALETATQRTFLKIVQVCTSVEDLKILIMASIVE